MALSSIFFFWMFVFGWIAGAMAGFGYENVSSVIRLLKLLFECLGIISMIAWTMYLTVADDKDFTEQATETVTEQRIPEVAVLAAQKVA